MKTFKQSIIDALTIPTIKGMVSGYGLHNPLITDEEQWTWIKLNHDDIIQSYGSGSNVSQLQCVKWLLQFAEELNE